MKWSEANKLAIDLLERFSQPHLSKLYQNNKLVFLKLTKDFVEHQTPKTVLMFLAEHIERPEHLVLSEDVFVKCMICGDRKKSLAPHLHKIHNMSVGDYRKIYHAPTASNSYLKSLKESARCGEHNPAYNHGGLLSPWSKYFVGYETEEEAESVISMMKIKQSKTMSEGASPRTLQYWLNKGYDLNTAKQKLSGFQKNFSRKICIEKYGEEEGIRVWQDRQNRWQSTINSKTKEEILKINRKKLKRGTSKSFSEEKLISFLSEEFVIESNFPLPKPNKKNWYYYDIRYQNKIIEFNGDFWHANPKKYSPEQKVGHPGKPTRTAQEIWDADQEKINVARNNGYEVMVVWENDWHMERERVLLECRTFLNQ